MLDRFRGYHPPIDSLPVQFRTVCAGLNNRLHRVRHSSRRRCFDSSSYSHFSKGYASNQCWHPVCISHVSPG